MAWDDGNFLSSILGQANSVDPSFMRPSAPTAPPQMAAPKRERASVVDILGGLFDTAAELGGVRPQYQSSIDAANDRARQAESDQMTRELFPIEKQKGMLGNRETQWQIQERQAKLMGPLAQRALQYVQQGGDINRILPVMYQTLGLTPEEVQQYDGQIRANPIETLSMLASGGEGQGEYFGSTAVFTDETGNQRLFQLGKDGQPIEVIPPGMKFAFKLNENDLGDRKRYDNPYTAAPVREDVKGGPPATGDIPVYDSNGKPTGQYAQPPGSQANRERIDKISAELSKLEGLERGIDTGEEALGDVKAGIEMRAGSGAMTTPGMGMGARAWATAQDWLPLVERVFNEDATTGRNLIQNQGLRVILDLDSVLTQARDAGVEMGSKQMDTPKELQVRLNTIANSSDYESAVASYQYILDQAQTMKEAVRAKIAKKRAELERERGGAAPPKIKLNDATGPKVIRYDAQGNRLP